MRKLTAIAELPFVFIIIFVLVFSVSCAVKIRTPSFPTTIDVGIPGVKPQLSPSDIFQADEYLVAYDENYADGSAIYIGKMLTFPSEVTQEAEFLIYRSAKKVWSPHFWRVRLATAADLDVGNKVICFGNLQEGIYSLPKDISDAKQGYWQGGIITDLSLLAPRGIVYVSGDKVHKDNIFVVIEIEEE